MLFGFGSNGSGQLGIGHTEDVSEPQLIQGTDSTWQVVQLAAGGNHTVILCDDGKVRAFGNNEDGRCGFESPKQISRPAEMPLEELSIEVKQVCASWSSTALLSTDGNVYTCGTGNSGELGLGPKITKSPSLQRLEAFPPPGTKVTFLASGMAHTVAVLSTGEVYGWGKGRKRQIGEPAHDLWWPRKITGIEFGATQAVCGKDFTFVVGEPFTGEMVVLGPKSNDRFGIKFGVPAYLTGWKNIAASWGSIYAVKASGDVYAWGRDDHGQLPPQGLPEIENVAAGSEHCLALTRAGKMLAWGWGEHGNCGLPVDERGDVKQRWNEIEISGPAHRIFAGCATSFVFISGAGDVCPEERE